MPDALSERTSTAIVVDDNFDSRLIARLSLEAVGYIVTEANNGKDGLALIQAGTFDLLILDLLMPEMNGYEVLNVLRKDRRHDNLQIVVLTANAHMAMGDAMDMADFVMVKPVDALRFSELVKRLKQQHHSQASPQAQDEIPLKPLEPQPPTGE